MLKVGLTGGIASGKTTVCHYFEQLGVPIIDADIIARQLVEIGQPCYQQIINTFSKKVCSSDGQLDRAYLRQLIFSDENAKQQLEQILHPVIRQRLIEQSNACQSDYCLLAVPLLIEADMIDLVNHVLVIDTPVELQLQRLIQRDDITAIEAKAIIKKQCSRKTRLRYADEILINDATHDSLQQKVDRLHHYYLKLAN